MAKIIGIYNNKGGVGKTTLTLFLADFLSSMLVNQKKSRILVLDFDPQNSCASSALGLSQVSKQINQGLTIPKALMAQRQSTLGNINDYITTRSEKRNRRTGKARLGDVDVMTSDPEAAIEFDDNVSLDEAITLAAWLKQTLTRQYDFIFVDLPGNLSKHNRYSLVGAFFVDHLLIPTEPNRINSNAMPATLKMVNNLHEWSGTKKPKVLGFVLNKTDRRTKQYKLHHDELTQFATIANSKIYDSVIPPAPTLANASDDSIDYVTLIDKYDNYYNNVRTLVIEIARDLGFKRVSAKRGNNTKK